MDITSLEFEVESSGKPKVSVWCKCRTVDDVDDIIAWLHLAKNMMQKWEKIRSRRVAQDVQRSSRDEHGGPSGTSGQPMRARTKAASDQGAAQAAVQGKASTDQASLSDAGIIPEEVHS